MHRLALVLLSVQLTGILAVSLASIAFGPPVLWRTAVVPLVSLTALIVLWVAHVRTPGPQREWIVPETLAAVGIVILASMWLGPGQYLVAGLQRPLVDSYLASGDGLLGIDVSRLAAWTTARPVARALFALAYGTLIAQFALGQLAAGLLVRDREAPWEYAWHFTFCATVTLASWALWPAAGAFQYLGFTSTLSQGRFIRHFVALRNGAMPVIDMGDLEGLISMPSFHVIGALIVTWSLRGHRVAFILMALLNLLLCAATVMSGAHYAVDVLAAGGVFGVSVFTWRRVGRRLLPGTAAEVPSGQASRFRRSMRSTFDS